MTYTQVIALACFLAGAASGVALMALINWALDHAALAAVDAQQKAVPTDAGPQPRRRANRDHDELETPR